MNNNLIPCPEHGQSIDSGGQCRMCLGSNLVRRKISFDCNGKQYERFLPSKIVDDTVDFFVQDIKWFDALPYKQGLTLVNGGKINRDGKTYRVCPKCRFVVEVDNTGRLMHTPI